MFVTGKYICDGKNRARNTEGMDPDLLQALLNRKLEIQLLSQRSLEKLRALLADANDFGTFGERRRRRIFDALQSSKRLPPWWKKPEDMDHTDDVTWQCIALFQQGSLSKCRFILMAGYGFCRTWLRSKDLLPKKKQQEAEE